MAEGQALARGIQMGEAGRGNREINLESIIASLPGTRNWQRRRTSPATVRSNAANMALEERKLDLMERQQMLEERKTAIAERTMQENQRRQQTLDTEARGVRLHQRTLAAEDRATAAEDKAYQSGMRTYTQGRAEAGNTQQDAWNMARTGLGSGNAQPIVEYFDTYGNSSMRVENVEFGGGPHDPVRFQFSNGKEVTYKDTGEAMAMILAPTNPQLGLMGTKDQREERKVQAQEDKVAIERDKGKTMTAEQKADMERKVIVDVKKEMETAGARPEQYATDQDWEDSLIDQRRKRVFGSAQQPTKPQGAPATPTEGAGPQEAPGVRIFRNKSTGEMIHVYPDGTQERYNKAGNLTERQLASGEAIQPPAQEEEKSFRGEVHRLPIQREGERTTAIPPREQAAQEGSEKGSRAITRQTDKESGETTVRWIDEKGEVKSRVVPPKEGEKENKDKKKRKKKKRKKKD